MIEWIRAQEFGCVKDATLKLTPFHALIGPNDSGKSTLLRAIGALCDAAQGALQFGGERVRQTNGEWLAGAADGLEFSVHKVASSLELRVPSIGFHGGLNGMATPASERFGRAQVVRFDIDRLRRSSMLVPDAEVTTYLAQRGDGLPGVLMSVKGRDDDSWASLRKQALALFPTLAQIELKPENTQVLKLEFVLNDGSRVPVATASDGLLYYLAFGSLPYLRHGLRVLLVEEPENGLHPSRIAEVIRVLRLISESGIQVVMATHSPLVINEMKPEEVTVVTRDVKLGTRVKPISATTNFAKRSEVYALGELWLSYADGISESELVGS